MTGTHRFGDARLTATVSAMGAELQSIRDATAGEWPSEWLWQGGPEWPRRAPVLFPIVGRLPNDVLRHQGRAHHLTQHGFARDRRFEWRRRDATGCALRLTEDADTFAAYPFPFVLDLDWTVAEGRLTCAATVLNPANAPGLLPFSLGAHPAFAWPLPGASSPEGHALSFPGTTLEALPARRLTGGLLDAAETIPLPGGYLPLHPGLFDADAIVVPDFPGRRLRYAAPTAEPGAALDMGWEGFKDLGLWSRPGGAAFLCLEPWSGTAPPLGWNGDFSEKPGITLLEPGESRAFRWWVSVERAGS